MLLAFGWDVARIAAVVGMSPPTFRRNFFHELKQRETARDRLRSRVLTATLTAAMDGNVQAQKLMLAAIDKQDLADSAAAFGGETVEGRATEAKPLTLGKKEAARIAARSAQSDPEWGDDLQFNGGSDRRH